MKMKIFILFVLIAYSILIACSSSAKPDNEIKATGPTRDTSRAVSNPRPTTPDHLKLVTLEDGEKILGEPAHITDSTMTTQPNIVVYKASYTANAGTEATRGNVYFVFEDYKHQADAETKYAFIKASNEANAGFEELKGLGDEAYFHTDKKNFYFIMLRKKTKVVAMKVSKITPKTSEKAFREVAERIAETL